MKIFKKLAVLLLAAILACGAFAFAACDKNGGGDDDGSQTTQPETPTQPEEPEAPVGPSEEEPITIALSETTLSLNVGQSKMITAVVTGTKRKVRWFASSGLYFELEANDTRCVVKGLDGGEATLTAYVSDVSATASVTVIEKELTADYDLTADGDLSDWTEAGLTAHSISVRGRTSADDYKSATFYGVLEKDGLYLAADVYHDVYENSVSDFATWWYNSQFEFFVGGSNPTHYFVYATSQTEAGYALGKGSANTTDFTAVMKTESLGGEGQAQYHTVIEVFLPANKLPAAENAAMRVGVAWKSKDGAGDADYITGGESGGGSADKYWVPAGAWTDNADMPYVTQEGIFLRRDYEAQN